MKWFKFYGQDFLTDPKIRGLSIHEAMCWVTLMALANAEDKDGKISNITESEIMIQSKVEFDSPYWYETFGFIKRFEELKMLKICNTSVTNRNEALQLPVKPSTEIIRYDVILINFNKRQKENLSGAERQKKHREKVKNEANDHNEESNIDSNKTVTKKALHESYDSNARIDKNRLDKNIKETNTNVLVKKDTHTSLESLDEIDFQKISEHYQVPIAFVRSKHDDLMNWHGKNPKKNYYSNYYRGLCDWVKRDMLSIRKEHHDKSKLVVISTE